MSEFVIAEGKTEFSFYFKESGELCVRYSGNKSADGWSVTGFAKLDAEGLAKFKEWLENES